MTSIAVTTSTRGNLLAARSVNRVCCAREERTIVETHPCMVKNVSVASSAAGATCSNPPAAPAAPSADMRLLCCCLADLARVPCPSRRPPAAPSPCARVMGEQHRTTAPSTTAYAPACEATGERPAAPAEARASRPHHRPLDVDAWASREADRRRRRRHLPPAGASTHEPAHAWLVSSRCSSPADAGARTACEAA